METLKQHWEKIYSSKTAKELSWTQDVPETSLGFIHNFNLRKDAAIIDVGGGESRFVDFLLDEGFTNITVLDISEEALKKTQVRLGERAFRVQWINSDVTEFKPLHKFDVWHDRATFHFLTTMNRSKSILNSLLCRLRIMVLWRLVHFQKMVLPSVVVLPLSSILKMILKKR